MMYADEMLSSLRYFWEEKGDITRWVNFDRAEIAKHYPEVLKAWDDYQLSRRTLSAVLRGAEPIDA